MNVSTVQPLVSIGVPTFNRPELLARTLDCLINQTYRNLEIIVSDNASSDPSVAKTLNDYSARDSRIRVFRQDDNIGAKENFLYVLEKSTADYFVWAADDDVRESWYIEKCISVFHLHPSLAAVTTETQYVCGDELMPLIRQGTQFYKYKERVGFEAVRHALSNNFDNLIYALFRREALFSEGRCVWIDAASGAGNEIPGILYAAYRGGIVVLPDPGIIKAATLSTYRQARWEAEGGFSPSTSKISGYRSVVATYHYHLYANKEINKGLRFLDLPLVYKFALMLLAWHGLRKHFIQMLIGWKPRRLFLNAEVNE